MSYLLLHNGNRLVKPWASKFYRCNPMLCLADPWPNATGLQEKYQLAGTTNICTDLTTADVFDIKELFNAKQSLEIVKVITSYENDLTNIEPVWNNIYSKEQWLQSTFFRLSCADHVVFHQSVNLPSFQTEPSVVFTPGRSGSHVLSNIIQVSEVVHNWPNFLKSSHFLRIINATKVFSILRMKFVDHVMSNAIAKTYGIVLTTKSNYKKNCQYIATWAPITLSIENCDAELYSIFNYIDILLGIKIIYNKHVEFSLLEDLKDCVNLYIKNPYQYQDIISNYQEIVDICEQQYQPIYNQVITLLKRIFGISLYHR